MTRTSRLAMLAILAAAFLPVAVAAQQPAKPGPAAPKPTKAAAQKVVQIVSADKAKTKIYCDLIALGEALDAAAQKKDEKKMDELSQKADSMTESLGPEYVALMDGLDDLDPSSKEGQEIGNTLEALDKLCDAK